VWIFFIFRSSKIRVNPTDIVSSLPPPRCHLSFGQHLHVLAPCHASFPVNQDELAASALSSGNASSCHFPSRTETEALNPHDHTRPPSLERLTLTLHWYKKIISTLITHLTTQSHLYFASSLARAPHHRSSIHRHHSLSPLSHAHRPSTQ
jgi:hypothetical protein